jgi:ribonuclease D
MTKRELDRVEELRVVRDQRAAELEIDPTLIASKATLYALARNDPGAVEDQMPWQRALLDANS